MSQSGQDKIDVIEGRRLLREADYEPVPGSNSQRWEIWICPDGLPEEIPYVGPPYGRYLDKPSLDEVLRKAKALKSPAGLYRKKAAQGNG
jgi:hypothetical protein